jgi:hypothetical protein
MEGCILYISVEFFQFCAPCRSRSCHPLLPCLCPPCFSLQRSTQHADPTRVFSTAIIWTSGLSKRKVVHTHILSQKLFTNSQIAASDEPNIVTTNPRRMPDHPCTAPSRHRERIPTGLRSDAAIKDEVRPSLEQHS